MQKEKTPWPPISYKGRGRRKSKVGRKASEMPWACFLHLYCDGQRKIKIGTKSTDLGNPSTSLDV